MIGLHRFKGHDDFSCGLASQPRPHQAYLCFQEDFFDFDMDSTQTCGAAGLITPIPSPFSRTGLSTAEQDRSSCLPGDPAANTAGYTTYEKQSHLNIQDNTFHQPDTAQLQHVDQAGCISSPTALKEQHQQTVSPQTHWKPPVQQAPAVMHLGEWRSFSLPVSGPPSPSQQERCSTPAMNAAAKQVLLDCLTTLGGVSPAARSTLQQLVSSMASLEDSRRPASGSPVAAAAAATTGSPAVTERHVSAAERFTSMLVPSDLQQAAATAMQQPMPSAQQETVYRMAAPAAVGVSDAAVAANTVSPQLQVQPSVGNDAVSAAAAAVAAAGLTETKLLPLQQAAGGPTPSRAAASAHPPALPASMVAGTSQLAPKLSMQMSGGRSAVTHRTRVLAAELGVVRPGPAGSSLRLAGTICRSNSGTLVDSLLSEAARADAGLLTAAMPRSDSLPDALLSGSVPPAAEASAAAGGAKPGHGAADGKGPIITDSVRECLKDVQALTSLNITDLDIPMTWSGLPSLTALLEQKSLWLDNKSAEPSLAHAGPIAAPAVELPAQQPQQLMERQQLQQPQPSIGAEIAAVPQQQEQHQQMDAVMTDEHFGMQPTPFLTPAGMTREEEDAALPPPSPAPAALPEQQPGHSTAAAVAAHWVSKALGKAPSFNTQGRVAAALLAHGPAAARPGTPALPAPAATEAMLEVHRGPAATVQDDTLQHGGFAASAAPAAGTAAAAAEPLTLPHLLNPSDAFFAARHQQQPHMLPSAPQHQQYMPEVSAALKPSTSMQLRQMQIELGMFGSALAAAPGTLGLQHVQHQDTLDGLLEQVNQELMAEAYNKQRSVLQFGTAGTTGGMSHMSAAAGVSSANGGIRSPFTGITDMSLAGAQAGGMQWPPRGVDVYGRWHGTANDGGDDMGAANVGYPGLGAAAAVGYDPGVSRGLLMHGAVGMGTPLTPTAAAAAADGRSAGKQEIVRYSRVITCKTYLKRLNITQPMAEHLLPYHNVHAPTSRTTSTAAATTDDGDDFPKAGGKSGSSYELMFKEEVYLVDVCGARYKVVYEGVSCNQQKHLRLTSGWRDYIRGHGVTVGDTVVFERRGDDRHTLYVSVIKGDGELGGAAADDAEGGRSKKRRVSRSQAVQRLE